jgi:predicted O-linked N-acetylglucosamine transferase (SPINDLY family)
MDLNALGRQAVALQQQGRNADAEALYRQILAADPHVFPALCLLGVLRLQQGDTAEAADLLGRAVTRNPGDPAAQLHYGLALQGEGQFARAAACFSLVLAASPGNVAALMGRGGALRAQGLIAAALSDHEAVLVIDPGNADAWNGRGALLREMGHIDEALESFDRAIALDPGFAEALQNRGDLYWSDRLDQAAACADMERALAIAPERPWLRGNLLHLKMFAGDWAGFDAALAAIDDGVRAGAPVVHPFIYQALSHSPADLQRGARIYTRANFPAAPLPPAMRSEQGRLRIGYVASEFKAHALSYLTVGLFESHDKDLFEITAFDNGAGDGSETRTRLEKAFDRIVPIQGRRDADVAAMIRDAEIDLLVNLNGYFGTPRMAVFAMRPAPIQVSYMGFPATMGAPYIDYLIADRIVLPPAEQQFYDEKIAWMPDTYWVNDARRPIADEKPGRAECGLPPDAFVFCNFNNSYKLTPQAFAGWMRILQQVPASVLWLFESNNPRFAENLRREAAGLGVAPERLIFAPLAPSEKHLARLTLADLSLDCLPYNAHTTAADVLWAGVPLATCRGTTWPGRVAASLLSAMNLPELIAETPQDYEDLAVRLARDPALLAAIRAKVAQNRLTAPLFDTARWTRHLEAAYRRMWDRHRDGQPPTSFSV